MTSPRGERGPHGDHGQDGDMGLTGETGARGERGAAGLPADEHRVEVVERRGEQNVHRLTFLYLFVILALTGGAYLLHHQDLATERSIYNACEARNVNRAATNQAFANLSQIDASRLNGPGTTALQHSLALERGKAYAQAVRPLENCGHRP